MAWLSIRLSVPAARIEALCDLLMAVPGRCRSRCATRGCTGARARAPAKRRCGRRPNSTLCFRSMPIWQNVRARLTANWAGRSHARPLDVRFVEDADWSQTWRNHAVEYCFGDRLWVVPRDAVAAARRSRRVAARSGSRVRHRRSRDDRDVSGVARDASDRWLVRGRLRRGVGNSRHCRAAAWRVVRGRRRPRSSRRASRRAPTPPTMASLRNG